MATVRRQRDLLAIIGDHEKAVMRLRGAIARITSGGVDHGTLSGLGDDDHTQYLLATGARDLTGQQAFTEGTEAALGISSVGNLDTGLKLGANVDIVRDGEHRIEIGVNLNIYDADGSTVRYSIVNDGDHIFDDPDGQERYRITNNGNHLWTSSGGIPGMAFNTGDVVIYDSAGAAAVYYDDDFAALRVRKRNSTAMDYLVYFEDLSGANTPIPLRIYGANHATAASDIRFRGSSDVDAVLWDDSIKMWHFVDAQVDQVRMPTGTLSLPGIGWSGDSNSGLRWITADKFAAVAGAIDIMTWSDVSPYVRIDPPFGDTNVALVIGIERAWEFRQGGTGTSTQMKLYSTSNKVLDIGGDTNGSVVTIDGGSLLETRQKGRVVMSGLDVGTGVELDIHKSRNYRLRATSSERYKDAIKPFDIDGDMIEDWTFIQWNYKTNKRDENAPEIGQWDFGDVGRADARDLPRLRRPRFRRPPRGHQTSQARPPGSGPLDQESATHQGAHGPSRGTRSGIDDRANSAKRLARLLGLGNSDE